LGKSLDIGVDNNWFRPWSLDAIEKYMATREAHHTIDNTGRGADEGIDTVRE
jgi:hypothetical protein